MSRLLKTEVKHYLVFQFLPGLWLTFKRHHNWRFFPSSCLFLLTQLRLFLVLVNGHVSQGRLVMGRREGDYQICCMFVDHVHTQNSTICNNVSIVLLAHGDDLYHLDYTASRACNFSCSPHVLITSISIFCRKIHVLI